MFPGSADWLNPKLATRPEDQGKNLPSAPGPHDFGAIRTRAEVTCALPIFDVADHEKRIGTLSVVARVKVPLNFNPKDRSGADTQRVVYSDAERQSLVFAEQPDSVDVAREAAAKAPKKAALPPPGGASGTRGDSNLVAVAKQFQLQVAVLENPDSFAAYGQSYAMVEQQMGLIALEIQVRTAMYARCSHQFPLHDM